MSLRRLSCSLCLLIVFSQNALSWSGKGHAFIAESSIQGLGAKTKRTLIEILKVGPWNKNGRYKSLESLVAQASKWPDWVKGKTVKEIFKVSGSGVVPAPIKAYKNSTTQSWHYANVLFFTEHGALLDSTIHSSNESCVLTNKGELFRVWPLLIEAYQKSSDRRNKALLLAFILHLGADAYQPLHVLSALNKQCEHDAGGNGYCVKSSGQKFGNRKCRKNLHQLWDQGFGYFDEQLVLSKQVYPSTVVKSLHHVLLRHKPYLESVYPKAPSLTSNADYEHRALLAVTQLSADSVAYLMFILTYLEPV